MGVRGEVSEGLGQPVPVPDPVPHTLRGVHAVAVQRPCQHGLQVLRLGAVPGMGVSGDMEQNTFSGASLKRIQFRLERPGD